MEFLEVTETEFKEFAINYKDNNLWQTPYMAKMREKRGYHTYYLGVKDNDNIIAGCMASGRKVFFNQEYFQILRGPLIDYKNKELFEFFHKNLVKFFKKHNCMYFHTDPYVMYRQRDLDGNLVEDGIDNSDVVESFKRLGYSHEGFTRGINLKREPRWIYTIPVEGKTPDEVLKNMERKAVRSIKRVKNYKIQINELSEDELNIYDKVIHETEVRRGFEGRSEEYTKNIYECFVKEGAAKFLSATLKMEDYKEDLIKDLQKNQKIVDDSSKRLEKQESPKIRKKMELAQEQVEIFKDKIREAEQIIKEDGPEIMLASGMFFTYGREVLCLMSGVYEKYMHFLAPYAMHWTMINYCIEHGMERYNLYGISGIFDKTADDYGVYLFKKGFNGEVVELIGDFEYIVNPRQYNLYNFLRSIKHKVSK